MLAVLDSEVLAPARELVGFGLEPHGDEGERRRGGAGTDRTEGVVAVEGRGETSEQADDPDG